MGINKFNNLLKLLLLKTSKEKSFLEEGAMCSLLRMRKVLVNAVLIRNIYLSYF